MALTTADPNPLDGQLAYYRARAPEYDEWWLRKGRYDRGAELNNQWFAESSVVETALEAARPSGRVLEIACGTGLWSERLLPHATSLTLVDGSQEMLEIAAHRLQSPEVRYVQANIFEWQSDAVFDFVYFSFWLSHVPPTRFDEFWDLIARCLAPGGRVFFIDSRREQTGSAVDQQLPVAEDVTQTRRLNDGREFQIFKIFHDVLELQNRLNTRGWDITVSQTERYFIHGQGGLMT